MVTFPGPTGIATAGIATTGIVVAALAGPVAPATASLPAAGPEDPAVTDRTEQVGEAIEGGTARNVILFIGDGMGESEITIARNYAEGAAGRLAMDALPLTGDYTTYSVAEEDPSQVSYVTDSAAAGTAWATGTKTYNGAISVDPDGNPVPTILEQAKQAGFRTGDVSTAEVTDATPAVLASHVIERDCKGPEETSESCPSDAIENGGAGSIAEQMIQTRPDVILGGGKKYFDETVTAGGFAGQTVLDQAGAAGYDVVTDAHGLDTAGSDAPLLGLFAPENMDLELAGPAATVGGRSPERCEPNPERDSDQPHLADMTEKALAVLGTGEQAPGSEETGGNGFFLQVEGASIDKQDHAANPCGQIGETIAFDDAVAAGLDYADTHPDTLVIVTADHGHTSQIIPTDSDSPGLTATLITADDAPMTINYGTAEEGESQQHTGTEIRVAAAGPQAANVTGLTDQTDLYTTMARALGLATPGGTPGGGVAAGKTPLGGVETGNASTDGPESPALFAAAGLAGVAALGALAYRRRLRPGPRWLTIPSLGVSDQLEVLDLDPDRSLQVPRDPDHAGWFRYSAEPGEVGPTVIAGHVTWNRHPAVFFALAELGPGDLIEIEAADGAVVRYQVTGITQAAKRDFPTEAVYGDTTGGQLRLITCGGEFDATANRYLDNLIVFATLV